MIKIILFTLLLAGVLFIGDSFLIDNLIHPKAWLMLGFFCVLTLVSHLFIERGVRKQKDSLMPYYFGATVFRFFVSIIFLIIFILNHTTDVFVFVGNFFILYLLYIGFEIWWLMSTLRRNSQ